MYDDDRDALAAEYVLGTLSGDERDQAEALLLIDPGFAEIVRGWERRLGELNVMVEAVEPPPEIWESIKTDIDGAERRIAAEAAQAEAEANKAPIVEDDILPTIEGVTPQTVPDAIESAPETPAVKPEEAAFVLPETPAEDVDAAAPEDQDDGAAVSALASSLLPAEPTADEAARPSAPESAAAAPAAKIERSAEVIYLAGRVQRLRGLTVGMSAIAALLAIYVGVSQFAPSLLPAGRRQATVSAPVPQSRLVAVLQQEPTAPAFLLTVDPQSRSMTVRRLTASPDPGRSYELWLIANNNRKPQSLGLVGASEFTTRPLPQGFDVAALPSASYAISLEPAGGSPSGVPTGPILFKGKMVEAVPAAPAPKS